MRDYKGNKDLPVCDVYNEYFTMANGWLKEAFKGWVFKPGMRFGETPRWWGRGMRNGPHEGIDLASYKNANGELIKITPGTRIPVIFSGIITAIRDDYLGKSIFVRHPQFSDGKRILFTAYGHSAPDNDGVPGTEIKEGETPATVADPGEKRPGVPGHLHISTGWIPADLATEDISWNNIVGSDRIVLFDPGLILRKL